MHSEQKSVLARKFKNLIHHLSFIGFVKLLAIVEFCLYRRYVHSSRASSAEERGAGRAELAHTMHFRCTFQATTTEAFIPLTPHSLSSAAAVVT